MRVFLLAALALVALLAVFIASRPGGMHAGYSSYDPPLPPAPKPHQPDKHFSDDELRTDPQVKALTAQAATLLVGLKKASDDCRLTFLGSDQFQPDTGYINYDPYGPAEIQLNSKERMFSFQQQNNHLAVFVNPVVVDLHQQPPDGPDKPNWTSDQAKQVGTAFLKVLAGDSGATFGPPKAIYKPPYGKGKDYHPGFWWLGWTRVDPKGIPYASNGVTIDLSETYGVQSAGIHLDDVYVEEKGKLLSAADAVDIATKSHPAAGTQSSDITHYTLKSCDLMIVEPYDRVELPCRLGWVIWLQPVRSGIKPGPGYDDSQEITVDALSGKIIGSDFML